MTEALVAQQTLLDARSLLARLGDEVATRASWAAPDIDEVRMLLVQVQDAIGRPGDDD